ncbi:MAG: diguanylate cyclase [Prochloraceae cyanobacterium]|nr:diguanylate cyclase [Prochloraceae cyanobacterium]
MVSKILVVDDEPDLEVLLRQKFRKKIKENELEFFFASNGVEALAKLADKPDIDMVLTDINMPQMDGLTLLQKIKELNPFLKAVIVSAYGDMENIRRAMNLGAFDFLVKPINFQDLEITTQRTLSQIEQIKCILEKEFIAKQNQVELSNKIHQNEKKLAQFLNAVPIGICAVDAESRLAYINQNGQKILGMDETERVIGEKITDIYQAYFSDSQKIDPFDRQPIMRAFQGEKVTVDNFEIQRKDRIIPLEISATPIYNREGEIVYAIAIFQDITQRKQAEMERIKSAQKEALLQHLNFLANYDSLTKIANRRRCDEYIKQEWQRMAWEKQSLSLIVAKIDRFQEYQDYCGDRNAENCLIEVTKAIRTIAERPGYLISRYSNETFVLVLPNSDRDRAANLAEQIRQAVKNLEIENPRADLDRYVTISLGIASTIPSGELSYKTLISKANSILDRAIELGGDRVCDDRSLSN